MTGATDSPLSSELQLAFAPEVTYRHLLASPPSRRWTVLRRPAMIVLVIAVMTPIMAVQRVTIGLVATAALSWCFAVALQTIVAVAIIASAPRRQVAPLAALDLWFAGHVPYSLWMLCAFAVTAMTAGRAGLLIVSAVVPAMWTAFIVSAFSRTVLSTTASGARWRAAAHFVSIWSITLSYIAWAGRWMVSAAAVNIRPSRARFGAILAAAIVIGTLADRVPLRAPRRAGDYYVLEGDFHVHAFPGDGALAPWTLRDEAAREGLDVLAVTNHNRTLTARFAQWMAARSTGPIIISGQEITNPAYHLIAVGIERTVNADQPAKGAIADVHAQGGVAIAAHPTPKFHGYDDDPTVATLDGTEAAHPSDDVSGQPGFTAFFERARRLKPTIAAIGSSDFHVSPPQLARCRTFVFARQASAAGVIDAIRSGRTVALDEDGRRHGDPRLIELLGPQSWPDPRDRHRGWRRASLALAWVGLLGMVLFA